MGHWTITALREAYRSGEVSPVEIVDAALVRIKRWNLHLRAYLQVGEKQARKAARESERRFRFGDERGPLDGVPVAYKDLCHIPGIPTTCGSLIFRNDPPPDATSSVWRRLENAGAVNMGKLNMAELAMGPTGRNMHFGDPQNPWKRGHVTGGSSSGSACAVAAGLALAAIGSDTGGSIRVPAALCGVVGLKPTNGRVSRHGAIPLSWTLDSFGPLTRTAADNALVLSVIAGADPLDSGSSARPVPDYARSQSESIEGVRVGALADDDLSGVSVEMRAAYAEARQALERRGARVERMNPPCARELEELANAIFKYEALKLHGERLQRRKEEVTPEVMARLEAGRGISEAHYRAALARRDALIHHYKTGVFSAVDALLSPTTPAPAPSHAEARTDAERLISDLTRFTRWVNVIGAPAISLPRGFSKDGLPLSVQLVGPDFSESALYKIASALEEESGGGRAFPDFASFDESSGAP